MLLLVNICCLEKVLKIFESNAIKGVGALLCCTLLTGAPVPAGVVDKTNCSAVEASCPQTPGLGPVWRPYAEQNSRKGEEIFHCGFTGYLAPKGTNRKQAECMYDHQGKLVTEQHPFAGCRGTDNWASENKLGHLLFDVIPDGPKAALETVKYKIYEIWHNRGIEFKFPGYDCRKAEYFKQRCNAQEQDPGVNARSREL